MLVTVSELVLSSRKMCFCVIKVMYFWASQDCISSLQLKEKKEEERNRSTLTTVFHNTISVHWSIACSSPTTRAVACSASSCSESLLPLCVPTASWFSSSTPCLSLHSRGVKSLFPLLFFRSG